MSPVRGLHSHYPHDGGRIEHQGPVEACDDPSLGPTTDEPRRGPMSEEQESAELAMARALDGRPMPEWKPTRRAATDAPWIIKALRQEGYEVRAAAHPQEQALDVERLAISQQDFADTICFLDDHDRASDQSACTGCEDFAAAAFMALRARLSTASEPGEPQP